MPIEPKGYEDTPSVGFTGSGGELFGILFRGYILMVPTVGIYRFWLTTWKRRFYWQNTVIDGDPLEYTGRATQLLVGFLFALGFFLPIYIAFFYLSTQTSGIAALGYSMVAVVIWFLMGYATYRARDFRLSRTLWRGIRFDQKGNAWGYAIRRFLWSILMVITAGLVFPFMVSNLWRYRYRHTWYGDRQFSITGNWRNVAGPWFRVYFGYAFLIAVTFGYIGASHDYTITGPEAVPVPGPGTVGFIVLDAFMLLFCYCYWRARETSRMLSTVHVGDAAVTVKLRTRTLLGQFVLYGIGITGALIGFGVLAGLAVYFGFSQQLATTGKIDPQSIGKLLQSGWVTILLLIAGYLVVIATLGLFSETILGFGYWRAVARGAVVSNVDSLRSVRATDEDQALAGEGLADALNVGSY